MLTDFENEFQMPKDRLQIVTQRRISSPTKENNYRNKFSRHFQKIREFKDPALNINSTILHKFKTKGQQFDVIKSELRDQLASTLIDFETQNYYIKKKFAKKNAEYIDFDKLNNNWIPQLFTFEPPICQPHSNTQFVFINQNIRRTEVINHLFPYNFCEEMRSNFKLAILQYSKEQWAINRNQLFIKVLKKFTILKDIVYKVAVFRMDQLNKPIQHLNLKMNDLSFKALFEVYKLGMIKMPINQLNFHQSAKFKLIIDLNKMSYLVDPYLITSSNKYICIKCGNIDFNCECDAYDNLYSLCKLFNYRNSIKIQKRQKANRASRNWGKKYEEDYTQEACCVDCFKLKIDDLEDKKVIQIDELNIKIDNDLCILARQKKISCSTIYNQFIIEKKYNYRLLLERIKLIQRTFDQQTEESRLDNYQPLLLPCRHEICDQNCLCNWVGCGKYCECKCDRAKMKCDCDVCIPEECYCYKRGRECDPLLCGCCQENINKLGRPYQIYYKICWNLQILLNNKAPIWLGRSKVCPGFGAFAKQFIPKNRLITLYLGEVIHENEEEIMDQIEESPMFYLFKTTDDRYSIEAKHFGNEARFINHSDQNLMNCEVQPMYSKNSLHLAIISLRDIEQEEELFINYKLENPDLFPWMRNVTQINNQRDLFKITKPYGPQMQMEQKFKFDKSIVKQKITK